MTPTLGKMAVVAILVWIAQFACAADIPFAMLVGKWQFEMINDAGDLMVTKLEITPDHTFRGVVTQNDLPHSTFDGTCELNGKELTCTYLHSSIPVPDNMQDTIVILNIDEQQIIFKSKKTNQPGLYKRIE